MISPNTVNFTYKKYGAIPPAVLLTFDNLNAVNGNLNTNYPDFIELYDDTATSVKIRLKAPGADALSVGVNTYTIDVYSYETTDNQGEPREVIGFIYLNITVEDTILLNATPNSVAFSFQIGGSNPVNKLISVSSENNWSITKTHPWLSLSTTSGSNSGSFEIGVITTGLTAGSYTDTVVVNDGVNTENIAVTFTVTDANTGTNYLYVNPSLLKFGFTVGGSIPPAKNIELNASDSFTASVNKPWLNLPTTSGNAGAQIIQLALVNDANLTNLTQGTHYATVTLTVGTIVKTVDVELEVYSFTAQTPSNSNLLFTEQENTLALTSGRLDTFMELNYTAIYNSKLFNFTVRLPFFQGGATRNIGVIPSKILGNQKMINVNEFAIFQPYLPITLNIETHEKELFTEAIVASSSVNNLKFLKGYKPTGNLLSEISKTIFLTTKATLCFSVLSDNVTEGAINITGAITKSIDVSEFLNAGNDFYTVVLPIADLADFREGHEINIEFLGETITVVIVDEGIDHTMVFWENNNGCFDALELKGEVAITPEMNRKTANFRLTRNTSINKTLAVTKPKSYSINTGIIHTEDELIMIENMLYSKNIYLKIQGKLVEVVPSTTKIPGYKTLNTLKGFDINFKNAEE
jgi:hypothetical protein